MATSKLKPGDFVLDECGCIYKVMSLDKDRKGKITRVWFRHKEDVQNFYLSSKDIGRLKRIK